MTEQKAVIEIGSTGIRLLVAQITEDNKRNILDRSELPVSIGRDVFTKGSISRETLLQCIQILNRFAEQLEGWGIFKDEVTVIGTSAVREAANKDPFVDRIKVKTGFTIKVIDGIEENRLMYLAVNECLKEENIKTREKNAVILEIAGASTEIMLIEKGKMAAAHTLRLGTVIIEQQFHSLMGSLDDSKRYIEEFIANTKGSLDNELNLEKIQQFIALGSDMRLASLFIGKPVSTYLWEIKRDDFEKFVDEIQHYTIDECIDRFKMNYSEAQTLQISLLTYKMFVRLTNVQTIIVPETSIREGLLISQTQERNEELDREFNLQIIASAKNLLTKYKGDTKHAEYVKNLCLKFYDKLKDELGLPQKAKLLLEVSSILHDIGMFISAHNHNLHGHYIIEHSEIFGLSRDERSIVAQIISYHRGNKKPSDDEEFKLLSRQDRMTILKLSAILRVCDALDRSHLQKLKNFTMNISNESFTIRVKENSNLLLEQKAISEKGDLFENVFGYKIVLI